MTSEEKFKAACLETIMAALSAHEAICLDDERDKQFLALALMEELNDLLRRYERRSR